MKAERLSNSGHSCIRHKKIIISPWSCWNKSWVKRFNCSCEQLNLREMWCCNKSLSKKLLVFSCFFVCFVLNLLPGYTWTFTMSLVCYKNIGLNRRLASSLYIWQGEHNTLIDFAWGSGKHKWTKTACLPHFCRHEPDVGMLSFRAAPRALFSTCSIWMYDRSWWQKLTSSNTPGYLQPVEGLGLF